MGVPFFYQILNAFRAICNNLSTNSVIERCQQNYLKTYLQIGLTNKKKEKNCAQIKFTIQLFNLRQQVMFIHILY